MKFPAKKRYTLLIGGLIIATTSGCATIDRKVSLLYSPVTSNLPAKGDLAVAVTGAGRKPASTAVQWILGTVKKDDGETVGTVVSTMSPEDLVLDAFKQELARAGYSVNPVTELQTDVPKGIVIPKIAISLAEEWSIPKEKAAATLNVTVEVWRGGKMVRKLSYESRLSDFAVRDRDLLAQQVIEKGLHEIMRQAIQEIVSILEH